MYVCMYVCVYACIHVCMHVYVYLCKVFYILHAYMLSLHNLLTYGSNIEDNFLYGREATSCQEDLHTHHSGSTLLIPTSMNSLASLGKLINKAVSLLTS